MQTKTKPPLLDPSEACRILTNPALCAANPSLQRLAWCAMATARGKPASQIRLIQSPSTGDAA